MKRKLTRCLSLLILSMTLVGTCYGKQAKDEITKVEIQAEDCNLTVNQATDQEAKFDYKEKSIEVTKKIENNTLYINIKKKKDVKADKRILNSLEIEEGVEVFIPSATQSMVVNLKNAGINIHSMYMDLDITNQNGACSFSVPEKFNHQIQYTCKEGSSSIVLNTNNDFKLVMQADDSAISVAPSFPLYEQGKTYEYITGTGEYPITLHISDSALSLSKEEAKSKK